MFELLNGKAQETAPTQNRRRNMHITILRFSPIFTDLRSLLRSHPPLIATSPESLQTSIPVRP